MRGALLLFCVGSFGHFTVNVFDITSCWKVVQRKLKGLCTPDVWLSTPGDGEWISVTTHFLGQLVAVGSGVEGFSRQTNEQNLF